MFDAGLERQIETAKRHRDFPEPLADTVRKQSAPFGTTKESFYLSALADEVRTELNGLTQRLRFEINPHGILFSLVTPLHQIEDLLIQHFMERFPYFVALESRRGTFVGKDGLIEKFSEPLSVVLGSLERVLPQHPILSRLDIGEPEVWESFYSSLPTPGEKASVLQNLPLRFSQPQRNLGRFFASS